MSLPKINVIEELRPWLEELSNEVENIYYGAEKSSKTGKPLPLIQGYRINYWDSIYNRLADLQADAIEDEIEHNIFVLQNENQVVVYLTKLSDFIGLINEVISLLEGPRGTVIPFYYKQQEARDLFTRFTKLLSAFRSVKEQIILFANRSPIIVKYSNYFPNLIKVVTPIEQEITSTEPNIKLQWNGRKRVLYDLFAQLTLIETEPGKGLIGNSIKDLARFLSDNVEGFATANTIERELEKMREPQGIEKAKRGRIDLHIIRGND